MTGRRYLLVALTGLAIGLALVGSVSAGLFSHKAKPSSQRAGELIATLRNDPDEKKRAAAADELGSYDLKTYPEIVPPLLQALNDTASEVRLQAVQTLGKLRPVSQEIGMALEQTHASDSSMKVRMQARTTLWSYHLAGYRSPKNPAEPKGPTLPNPPQPNQGNPAVVPNQGNGPVISTTQEPPLADHMPPPAPAAVRLFPAPVAQPAQPPKLQPPAPAVARPVPTGPSTAQPPPAPPQDLGPSISAPK